VERLLFSLTLMCIECCGSDRRPAGKLPLKMTEFEVSQRVLSIYRRLHAQKPEAPLDCAQRLLSTLGGESLHVQALENNDESSLESFRFFLLESCVILRVHNPALAIESQHPLFRELLSRHQVELGLLVNFSVPTPLIGIKKYLQAVH